MMNFFPIFSHPLIQQPSVLLIFAFLLLISFSSEKISSLFRVPSSTVQIFAGILIGPYVFFLFDSHAYDQFYPLTNFALGFIGMTIGSHFDLIKIRNAGKRILIISVIDLLITPLILFIVFGIIIGLPLEISLMISVIAAISDPGSTIHVIKENRAKGSLTKTILASVVLNNVFIIGLFYLGLFFLQSYRADHHIHLFESFGSMILMTFKSLLIGGGAGALIIIAKEKLKVTTSFLPLVLFTLVLTVGVSEWLEFSTVLSSLILGITITNFSKNKNVLFGSFKDIEKEIFGVFFILAGTHFDFHLAAGAGTIGFLLIIVRLIVKSIVPVLGANLSGSTRTVKKWIGLTFHPLAGVAIGLVLVCQGVPVLADYHEQINAVILTAVIFNEIFGPILLKIALKHSQEAEKDRLRLMDFLHEEYIDVGIEADNKWDALDQMSEFLYNTHQVNELSLEQLKQHIIDREKEFSTGVGEGLAVPHAIIEGGPKIRGVIGISKKGIPFDSVDRKPVRLIILIATPKQNYDYHLHLLANLAKIFGQHPYIREKMLQAKTSEEVYEVLQGEDVQQYNPFFEE